MLSMAMKKREAIRARAVLLRIRLIGIYLQTAINSIVRSSYHLPRVLLSLPSIRQEHNRMKRWWWWDGEERQGAHLNDGVIRQRRGGIESGITEDNGFYQEGLLSLNTWFLLLISSGVYFLARGTFKSTKRSPGLEMKSPPPIINQ